MIYQEGCEIHKLMSEIYSCSSNSNNSNLQKNETFDLLTSHVSIDKCVRQQHTSSGRTLQTRHPNMHIYYTDECFSMYDCSVTKSTSAVPRRSWRRKKLFPHDTHLCVCGHASTPRNYSMYVYNNNIQ